MTARARVLSLALALTACRPGGAVPRPAPQAIDPCLIAPWGSAQRDTVVIGADGEITTTFALEPRTEAERFAFTHIYETLVRVDCHGRLLPALADGWRGDSTGQRWTLTLRRDASFRDGIPVTAPDVVAAWTDRRLLPNVVRDPRGPAVDAITVESARTITVHLREAHPEGPTVLADPAFAVHRQDAHKVVPVSTGTWLLAPGSTTRVGTDGITGVLGPNEAGAGPVLLLRHAPPDDARDLIDRGIDVMVSSDRRVIEYAALRSDLRMTPLAADRAYILVSTLRSTASAGPGAVDDPRWTAVRASLARDVVRDTSQASGAPWWGSRDQTTSCGLPAPERGPERAGTTPATGSRRIVYPASDRLAGQIAERIVALVSFAGASGDDLALPSLIPEWYERTDLRLVAAGLNDAEFESSLRHGGDLGYIVVAPRRALDACAAWQRFSARAPWMRAGQPVLLAEARPTLIRSAAAPPLTIDWDNTLRIVPIARRARDRQ